jgi:hypothetical protein
MRLMASTYLRRQTWKRCYVCSYSIVYICYRIA